MTSLSSIFASVSSSSHSVPKSLEELNKRFDVFRKDRDSQILGMPKGMHPQQIMDMIIQWIPNFPDTADLSLRSRFLEHLNILIPKNAKPSQMLGFKAPFISVFKEINDLNKPIQVLENQIGFIELNEKIKIPLSELCASRIEEYGSLIKKLREKLSEQLQKPIKSPDFAVFMSALSHLKKITKINNEKNPKKRLSLLIQVEEALNRIKGTQLASGYVSGFQIELVLLQIKFYCMDLFLHECILTDTFVQDFCVRNQLLDDKLTPEDRLKRGYKAFLKENIQIPAPKKEIKPSSKGNPLPKISKETLVQTQKADVLESEDCDEKEERLVSYSAIEPKYVPEELDFPFPYDDRVLRWESASLDTPLDVVQFPEYLSEPHPDVKRFHKFSYEVDRFYNSGVTTTWKNTKTQKNDTLYLVPGEILIKGEGSVRGAFAYCIGQDKVCYHRYFQPMTMAKIFATFQMNVFYAEDFPELKAPVREAGISSKDVCNSVSPDGSMVMISDPDLGMEIKLFRLNV